MTLPLTPEMLAAAYDFLKATPPFNKWGLPESEEVKFRVGRRPTEAARYQWDGVCHTITVSEKGVGYSASLLRAMAHEMVHLHLEETGMESRAHSAEVHNGAFRVLAAQVCKVHGFDPKAFY
jgi:hypothetical protein